MQRFVRRTEVDGINVVNRHDNVMTSLLLVPQCDSGRKAELRRSRGLRGDDAEGSLPGFLRRKESLFCVSVSDNLRKYLSRRCAGCNIDGHIAFIPGYT